MCTNKETCLQCTTHISVEGLAIKRNCIATDTAYSSAAAGMVRLYS